MKIDDLPDYAKKYKTKGYDVRKVGNEYYQYKVEHHREKDKKYPITKYIYIGKIDKEKGLILSNSSCSEKVDAVLEYGLSSYLFSYYKRAIQRSLFNISGEYATKVIKLGIINYIFNEVSQASLSSSYLTFNDVDALLSLYESNDRNKIKILKVTNKISSCLECVFKNDNDRKLVVFSLRNMTAAIGDGKEKINKTIPSNIIYIFEKYGAKYE